MCYNFLILRETAGTDTGKRGGSYDSSKKKAGVLSFSHADIANDFDFGCCVWAGNFRYGNRQAISK